jgi:hypothetical protein
VLHDLLIAAHATCAVVAFGLGLASVWWPPERAPGVFHAYLVALSLMVLFLVAVVLVDWAGLDPVKRGVFGGLLVLAGYTWWRGWQAARELGHRRGAWREAYVEDVGFTLIALFDGFVIVSAIDLGAPIWLVLAIGALGILAGRLGVLRLKARAARPVPDLAR